jgi:3',5'-cyclic AMP phosphodiesterase CpdA
MAYTLAHLSDPHLAPLPEPHWSELLNKRVTGYLHWGRTRCLVHDASVLAAIVADLKAHRPDHIAVTGDLANIALRQEFVRGRAWLQALGSPQQVSLVPGNHDAYVRAGMGNAIRQWGDYMCGDHDAADFPYLRRRGPLALIGLSSAVPTAPFMATGRLGPTQLARLAEMLDELKAERPFRVVLIHHPPVSAAKPHKRLRDAGALKRVLAEHGAELLLHGHDHVRMLNWLAGPDGTRIAAVGVPSASAAPSTSHDDAAYNLYAIDGAPGAWRCELTSRGINDAGTVVEQQRLMLSVPFP